MGASLSSRAGDAAEPPTTAAFGRALKRGLRGPDGTRPKTGALARRAGVSQSSMYAYLAGTTLPTAEVLDDILAIVPLTSTARRELVALRDLADEGRRHERPETGGGQVKVPDELLADPGPLFGREAVFAELDAGWAVSVERLSIAALTGAAGVGKTAAILNWGHRHRADFPDGTVYVDLAGFSPGDPREPGDVLLQLLRSLGVAESEIPQRTIDRAGRLRSVLAGRRVLMVLDNARDTEQVRHLLPGTAGPFVVVTSRDSLVGLTIEFGARPFQVAPLDARSSAEVLRSVDPKLINDDAVGVLLRRCAGLPLALRLIGAQLSQRGDEPLAALIADLGTGLDAFDVDSGRASVRDMLSWTEHRLPPTAVKVLHLVAAMPHAHCCAESAAALLGRDIAEIRAELRRLMRLHLIEAAGDGHHRMHDLVREYALERCRTEFSAEESAAAIQRIVDWVVDTGARSVSTFFHDEVEPDGPNRTSTSDVRRARTWLDQHVGLMIEMVRCSAAKGRPADTVRVVEVIRRMVVEGLVRHRVGLEMLTTGLDAARAVQDHGTAANFLRHLGWFHQMLGDGQRGAASLDEALELYRSIGDAAGEVNTLRVQASLHSMSGRLDEAVALYHRTLEMGHASPSAIATTHNNLAVLAGRAQDRPTALHHVRIALEMHLSMDAGHAVARTRAQLAEILSYLGDLAAAEKEVTASLTWARTVGSRPVEIEALNGVAALHWMKGESEAAVARFTEALEGATELEDRYEMARACEGLAVAEHAAGELDRAITWWRRAIQHYDAIGFVDADGVRERLAAVTAEDDGDRVALLRTSSR